MDGFKATVTREGRLLVVRVKGDGRYLWMDMVIDADHTNVMVTSDIETYVKHFYYMDESLFEEYLALRWLCYREWTLRKFVDEGGDEKEFDPEAAIQCLIEMNDEDNCMTCSDIDAIRDACGEYTNADAFMAAVATFANANDIDLPDEWYDCREAGTDYTAWQKRFADICAEVIAPAIEEFLKQEEKYRDVD